EVRGRAVDELEALARHRLPVGRGHALAHDPAGDRDELVVDVRDARRVDLLTNLLDEVIAPLGTHEPLEVGRHQRPPDLVSRATRRSPPCPRDVAEVHTPREDETIHPLRTPGWCATCTYSGPETRGTVH